MPKLRGLKTLRVRRDVDFGAVWARLAPRVRALLALEPHCEASAVVADLYLLCACEPVASHAPLALRLVRHSNARFVAAAARRAARGAAPPAGRAQRGRRRQRAPPARLCRRVVRFEPHCNGLFSPHSQLHRRRFDAGAQYLARFAAPLVRRAWRLQMPASGHSASA